MTSLVTGVLVSLLPPSLRASGLFDSPRVEDALIGSLPAIATTHSLAQAGEIHPQFDLLPVLPEAIAVFQSLRRMRLSFGKLAEALDGERRTARIPGVPRVSDAPNLAIALAGALYNASRRAAPEIAASEILAAYITEAEQHSPRTLALPGFGRVAVPDPAHALAAVVPGFTLPGTEAPEPVARSLFNPRRNRGR